MTKTGFSIYWGAICAAVFLCTGELGAVTANVVLSGLENPRDVAVAANGDIYVIQVGTAVTSGTQVVTDTGLAYFGTTGSVLKLAGGVGGVLSTYVSGLPMLSGGELTGGQGIVTDGSDVYISIGLGSNAANRAAGPTGAEDLGGLYKVGAGAFNPAPADSVDISGSTAIAGGASNPFHADIFGGVIYITDAGNNSVLSISGGAVTKVGILADIPVTAGPPPFTNFVPTGLAYNGFDQKIYVGGLSGYPFEVGASSIYTLDPTLPSSQTPELFADGFTHILDLDFAADGTLYVLEFDSNGLLQPGDSGELWAVSADGLSRELLLSEGLTNPTGLTVGPDGLIYITNNSATAGGGELLVVQVPEPGIAALFMVGLAGLGLRLRRRP